MLTIKAPAKINWFLEILGKRPDGYHEIETVMQAIDLFDEITVSERTDGQLVLECDIDLGDPKQNLVYRAAEILQKAHAPGQGAHIVLKKQIPHGAGLGGGSSDAANALNALNRLWRLNMHKNVLRDIVSQVGSDCAFFVEGGTAVCTGRGEIVRQLQDVVGLNLVILYPEDVCPTGKVYSDLSRHLTSDRRDCYLFHDLPDQLHMEELELAVFNRLQESALRVSKRLSQVWAETANEQDVVVRFVSGSGSSIGFLVADRQSAERLAHSFRTRALGQAYAVKTLPRGEVWG
ncbi:MAG: 4-(cytidine 5'-diphospho)-2-C-methyl-D-erythritol kinase [Planctomycetes bacterium]|nr:4-(cytidine 5'-diphospho)-2-C-methyl-D-erythritol kinase [Planctomycetota bacterium]